MPLGKYYCDYCDKQFQDTPFHRKRHLQSLHHQKSKAIWYSSPDFNQISSSSQPSTTPVCNRFIRTGSCPFADSCKYFHPNQNLPNRNMQAAGFTVPNSLETQYPMSRISSFPGGVGGVMLGNLPPSLRPPPEGGYPPLPFVDWG